MSVTAAEPRFELGDLGKLLGRERAAQRLDGFLEILAGFAAQIIVALRIFG